MPALQIGKTARPANSTGHHNIVAGKTIRAFPRGLRLFRASFAVRTLVMSVRSARRRTKQPAGACPTCAPRRWRGRSIHLSTFRSRVPCAGKPVGSQAASNPALPSTHTGGDNPRQGQSLTKRQSGLSALDRRLVDRSGSWDMWQAEDPDSTLVLALAKGTARALAGLLSCMLGCLGTIFEGVTQGWRNTIGIDVAPTCIGLFKSRTNS
jgi:hypothetical protein